MKHFSSGDIDSIPWNIILAFQSSRNSKEWNNKASKALGGLSTFADDFPFTAFKIASYNDGVDNPGRMETRSVWVPLLGTNYQALQTDMSRIKYSPWQSGTGQLHMLNFAADPALAHFSGNDAKRAVIIFARDKPFMDKNTPKVEEMSKNLVDQDIIPVFAVHENLTDVYQEIVNEIGFGAVVKITDGPKTFSSVIYRALNRIRGDIAVLPLEGSEGHLDISDQDKRAGKYRIKGLKTG